jgi:glycosyltransferase involved in cell wall biosynthesis
MIPPSHPDFSRDVSAPPDELAGLRRGTTSTSPLPDLVCLSHLRWNFVFQRPQHLMTRAARNRRVFFVEEPIFDAAAGQPSVDITTPHPNVYVVVPHLPAGTTEAAATVHQQTVVDELLRTFDASNYVLWYWTPAALNFTRHLEPAAVVFDCMDELSGFAGAPPALKQLERELLSLADVVFTGGYSLYEAKRPLHSNVHAFPSSVDVAHFAQALTIRQDPPDQASVPRPRLGFFGVIDERMDLGLVDGIAARRPDWHLVFLGPTAKIDPATLPRRDNIHYLGMKSYAELPQYLAGWDVAILPFAHNDATRFISPTKTPEYLAAGCPVVSTSIRDVVRPYGDVGLVHIADRADAFVHAAEAAMQENRAARLTKVNTFLAGNSWDDTWTRMSALIEEQCHRASGAAIAKVAHV